MEWSMEYKILKEGGLCFALLSPLTPCFISFSCSLVLPLLFWFRCAILYYATIEPMQWNPIRPSVHLSVGLS